MPPTVSKPRLLPTRLPPITPMPQPVPKKCLPLLPPVTYRAAAARMSSAVAVGRCCRLLVSLKKALNDAKRAANLLGVAESIETNTGSAKSSADYEMTAASLDLHAAHSLASTAPRSDRAVPNMLALL
jgi:hypothetical protein